MIQNIEVLVRQGFPIPVAVLSGKTATKIGEIRVKKLVKKNGKKSITLIHSVEVDDVLAHFGIPGMRWGYRKQRLATHLDRVSRVAAGTATREDRAAIRRRRMTTFKTSVAVGGAATAVVGALFMRKYLRNRGGLRTAITTARINRQQTQAFLKMHAAKKLMWGIK